MQNKVEEKQKKDGTKNFPLLSSLFAPYSKFYSITARDDISIKMSNYVDK